MHMLLYVASTDSSGASTVPLHTSIVAATVLICGAFSLLFVLATIYVIQYKRIKIQDIYSLL